MGKLSKVERKAVFLATLRETGSVRAAARAATPTHSSPRPTAWFYAERAKDETFAAQWADAADDYVAALEAEVQRRATGYEEVRVDSAGKVTKTTRFSDACLLALLRQRSPAWREKTEVTAEVTTKVDPQAFARAVEAGVAKLREITLNENIRLLEQHANADTNERTSS